MKKLAIFAFLAAITVGASVMAGPGIQNRDYYFGLHNQGCGCGTCAPTCALQPMELVDGPCCQKVCCPKVVGFADKWF
mgnify:CR=1 FL=1